MVQFQLVINAANPDAQTKFWSAALGYIVAPPPEGHASWDDFYRSIGVPEEELDGGDDSISDPDGQGPRIWFQQSDTPKAVPNRLHLDISASGGRGLPIEERTRNVDARVEELMTLGATVAWTHAEPGLDHYAVTMYDPEGNEFCVH